MTSCLYVSPSIVIVSLDNDEFDKMVLCTGRGIDIQKHAFDLHESHLETFSTFSNDYQTT